MKLWTLGSILASLVKSVIQLIVIEKPVSIETRSETSNIF
jgi:hypothetical protein